MRLIKGSELTGKKLYRFLPIDMTRNGLVTCDIKFNIKKYQVLCHIVTYPTVMND